MNRDKPVKDDGKGDNEGEKKPKTDEVEEDGKDDECSEEEEDDDEDNENEDDEEDDGEEEDDEMEDDEMEDQAPVDWSRGRCMDCARRGQLGRTCRNCPIPICGKPYKYQAWLGECANCKLIGLEGLYCLGPYCEDACSMLQPRPPSTLDPDESEEDTSDDDWTEEERRLFGLRDESDEEIDEDDDIGDDEVDDEIEEEDRE